MTYRLTTPPTAEPLTLAETRLHLRLDGNDEDALVTALIATARQHLENEAGLCLIAQTWQLILDRWPPDGIVRIAKSPVQAIEKVTVQTADGTEVDVSLEDHLLDGGGRPARLWLRDRPASGAVLAGISIRFRAGFGEAGADVPDTLKRALLIHVGHMFAYRGVVAPDATQGATQAAGLPQGYDRLFAGYRMPRI